MNTAITDKQQSTFFASLVKVTAALVCFLFIGQTEMYAQLNSPQAVGNITVGPVQNGLLPNANITASTSCCPGGHEPYLGRLFNQSGTQCWAAGSNNTAGDFWQVDMGSIKPVNGVVVQGRGDCCSQWVTSFDVAVSSDLSTWTTVTGGPFTGVNSASTIVVRHFAAGYSGQYVRIYPRGFNNHMSMRADVISIPCGTGVSQPVSMSAEIPAGANQVRWYTTQTGGSPFSTSQYVTVDVSETTTFYVEGFNTGNGQVSGRRTPVAARIYGSSFLNQNFGSLNICPTEQVNVSIPVLSGGNESTLNGYKIHTFTSSGTLTVPDGFNEKVEVLVVAGGGGGGMDMGGGGGGGGVVYDGSYTLTGNTTVTIGAGGWGAPAAGTSRGDGAGPQPAAHQFTIPATSGGNSSFGSLIATGGGFGGSSYRAHVVGIAGGSGGSGGGSSGYNDNAGTFYGGAGVSGQGNAGGNSSNAYYSGGGGGAGGSGASSTNQANGGSGVLSDILGVGYFWAGGGGGAGYSIGGGNGGIGGGGGGAVGVTSGGAGYNNGVAGSNGCTGCWANVPGGNAGANTGGGGGGGSHYNANNRGGNGGSGIVVVRYPDLSGGTWSSSNNSVATVNSSGVVTGVANGAATISYSKTSPAGCTITGSIKVFVYIPSIPPITGETYYCIGETATLSVGALPTGGTITSQDGYRIHSFTSTGNSTFNAYPGWNAEVLLVGGGGSGGPAIGGGGGGGGVVHMLATAPSAANTITVGAGGVSTTTFGGMGGASTAFGATAAGGGTSGRHDSADGTNGGNGGGAASNNTRINVGGISTGNSLGSNSGFIYGNSGGSMTVARTGSPTRAAGGGGAGAAALNVNSNYVGSGSSKGGDGIAVNILGTSYYWGAGGGGGTFQNGASGNGGLGGGGGGAEWNGSFGIGGSGGLNAGGNGATGQNQAGGFGGANTGSGGGGGSWDNGLGGSGGSGIAVIRYPETTGGSWSSDNTSVATVNPSTGQVTAQGIGTTNINYTYTQGTCTSTVSTQVNVVSIPAVPLVSNNGPVCEGDPVNLTASGLAPGSGGSITGGAYSYNGANQFLYTDNLSGFPTGSVATVEAWINPSAAQNDATYNGIVSFGPNPPSCSNRFLLSMSNDRRITFANWCNDYTSNPVQIPANQWTHIAVVINGTGVNNISIYYNGSLVSQGTTSNASSTNILASGRLTVGCTDPAGGRYFNGQIDNVRIWNTARTQAQLVADMNLEVPANASGLVARYNFNENINCQNNGAYNLTAVNAPSSITPAYYNYTWTGTNAPGASTNEVQTIGTAVSGNYTVVASATSGPACTSPASAVTTVVVNLAAIATAGSTTAFCESPSPSAFPLTGSSIGGGATTGAWSIVSGGGSLSTTAQTGSPATVTYTPAAGYFGSVTLRLTTNDPAGPCPAVWDDRTFTIHPIPTVNVGPALAAICQGGTSAALGGSVGGGATGGTWSSNVGGTFNSGATNLNTTWTPPAAYSGTATLTLLTNGGSCGTTSNSKQIVVNPNPIVTGHPSPITLCEGTTGSFSIAASGATTYQWQYFDGSVWVNINDVVGQFSGSQSSTLNVLGAPFSYNNRQIRCQAISSAGCITPSNSALFIVDAQSNAGTITGAPASICEGLGVTYTANGVIGTFNRFEYQWNGTGGTWQTLTTSNPFTWTSTNGGNTLYVRSVATNGVCPTVSSDPPVSTYINYPTPAQPGTISLLGLPCTGTQGFSIVAVPNATQYNWSVTGSGSVSSGQGTTSVNVSFPTAGSYTVSVTAQNSCGTSIARTYPISVALTQTPTVSIVSDVLPYNVCDGTTVTFTGTPFHQGSSPTYQWTLNGNPVGTNSLTYSNSTLLPDDQISLTLTSSETCVTSATASSNIISVTCYLICIGYNSGYATFTPGSAGLTGAYDEYEVSINNGSTWAAYTPPNTITTNGGVGSVKVRARRRSPSLADCSTGWNEYTLWNFWPDPTYTSVAQNSYACGGSNAVINVTGLLPSVTSTISYTINGGSPIDATGVVSDGLGAATFNAPVVNANHNQILTITTVTTTTPNSGCQLNVTSNNTVTLVVVPAVITSGFKTWTGLVSTAWENPLNWDCGGIPDSSHDVVIPAAPASGNYPVIGDGIIGNCRTIDIQGSTPPNPPNRLTIEGTTGRLNVHL